MMDMKICVLGYINAQKGEDSYEMRHVKQDCKSVILRVHAEVKIMTK